MGMQQMLLILLTVIIVGISISVGIHMFNVQAVNANRNAIIADLNNIAGQAIAFLMSPRSMGGGEGNWIPFDRPGHADHNAGDALGNWLNWPEYVESVSGDVYKTGNGSMWMNLDSWEAEILTIIGSGNEKGRDHSYNSESHGEDGCVEVKMTISKIDHIIHLKILN